MVSVPVPEWSVWSTTHVRLVLTPTWTGICANHNIYICVDHKVLGKQLLLVYTYHPIQYVIKLMYKYKSTLRSAHTYHPPQTGWMAKQV